MSDLRYLVGYCAWRDGIAEYYEWTFSALRKAGLDVEGVCITLDPPGPRLSWQQLDTSWRTGAAPLFSLYSGILERLRTRDVFINLHGANMHPEFISRLPVCTVFVCNDDPESTRELSMPAAWAYDCCLVGNIAEVATYRSWGIRHAYFQPLGFSDQDVNPRVSEASILGEHRDFDLVLFCERDSPWRRTRLDRLVQDFPSAIYRGRGWPAGFVPKEERLRIYGNARIGVNIHNSTGPINARTYELPANGMLQLCDNKSNLGKIFDLDREVVGFDTMAECIEKIQYYLENEDERRAIAARGFNRAWRDYHFVACWKRLNHIVSTVFREMTPRQEQLDLAAVRRSSRISTLPGRLRSLRHALLPGGRSKGPGKAAAKPAGERLPYADIWHLYEHIGPVPQKKVDVKLGILKGQAKEYAHYVQACQEMDVRHAVIDLMSDRWLDQLMEEGCDGYLAHSPHYTTVWRDVYFERVSTIARQLKTPVLPSIEEMSLYENKRMMSYWLRANNIPHPATHVFVEKCEALAFARSATYPKVYKTALGSAGSGVRVLDDFRAAEAIVEEAFSAGVARNPGDARDRQWGYVIFQEYIENAREFRMIRIGDSFFGHEKLPLNGMHSGSNLVRWGAPPRPLLDLTFDVTEAGRFRSMNLDVFVDAKGKLFVNELQCVFGSYNPSQMYIDDKPGRYRKMDGEWVFEEGLFCRNGCANLRVAALIDMLAADG